MTSATSPSPRSTASPSSPRSSPSRATPKRCGTWKNVSPATASCSTPGNSTTCTPPKPARRSPRGWKTRSAAARWCSTASKIGCSPANAIGARRSRSCMTPRASRMRSRKSICRGCSRPTSSSSRPANRRCARARSSRPGRKPFSAKAGRRSTTRWIHSCAAASTTCATSPKATRNVWSIRRTRKTGCPSTCISAVPNTPACTSSTRVS